MTKLSKKRQPKQKNKQIHWQSKIWSLMISIAGLSLVFYLLIFFLVPNLLPVERKLLAVVTTAGGGSLNDPHPTILMVGLNRDPRYNQAVWVSGITDLDHDPDLKAKLSHQLGMLVSDVVVIGQAWPADPHTVQLASIVQEEIWQQLKHEHRFSVDLLASWYLLTKGNSFSSLTDLSKLPKEFEKSWGSVLKAGDDCQIAVLNSTHITGLAGKLTDIIERNGGVVVRLKQYPSPLDRTRIYVDDSVICQQAVTQLQSLLIGQPEILPIGDAQNSYRAPLVIILGSDQEQLITFGNDNQVNEDKEDSRLN